jgi:hypothetical protein
VAGVNADVEEVKQDLGDGAEGTDNAVLQQQQD